MLTLFKIFLSIIFVFNSNHFIQIRCLRTGYRSVPLKNIYSEDLELASLLVHINITTLSVMRNSKVHYIDLNYI